MKRNNILRLLAAVLLFVVALGLTGCGESVSKIPSGVYVWQGEEQPDGDRITIVLTFEDHQYELERMVTFEDEAGVLWETGTEWDKWYTEDTFTLDRNKIVFGNHGTIYSPVGGDVKAFGIYDSKAETVALFMDDGMGALFQKQK